MILKKLGSANCSRRRSQRTADHRGRSLGEFCDLALPLVLERRGANDQHPFDAAISGQDFRGRQRLDRFAKTHFVADEHPAGVRGEQRPLALIIVERNLKQILERRAANPLGKRLRQHLAAALGVAHLGHERQHVFIAAQLVIDFPGRGEQRFESAERIGQQPLLGVEVLRRQPGQFGGAILAGAKPHFAPRAVLNVDFAVVRTEAGLERRLAAAPLSQPAEHELDVLAGSERAGGEVGAGAKIVAQLGPANGDAIRVLAFGIGDFELGEDRLAADVPPGKLLIAAKLPPQFPLPRFQRHPGRLMQPRQLRLAAGRRLFPERALRAERRVPETVAIGNPP